MACRSGSVLWDRSTSASCLPAASPLISLVQKPLAKPAESAVQTKHLQAAKNVFRKHLFVVRHLYVNTHEMPHPIERIFTAKRDKLYASARRIVRNDADAEDAVQEGLLQVWKHRDRLCPEDWVTWTFTACCNQARMMLRRRQVRIRWMAEQLQGIHAETPESIAGRREQDALVRRAVAGLPRIFREQLEMVDLGGMTPAAAAASLGIGQKAGTSRLHRGRLMMAEKIKTWEEHAAENAEEYRRQREEAWKKRQERENPEDPPLFHQPDEDTDC